jgi:O-methyltransferase
MSWRERTNTLLSRTTGYHLTRSSGRRPSSAEARLRAATQRMETAAGSLEQAARNMKAAGPKPQAKPAREFPADYDPEYQEIMRAVRPYTMTGNDKLHALISATRYVHRYRIPGAVVECGVWRGGSMHAVARTLDQLGDHGRDLYLYDTFEGMTEPTDKDLRYDGEAASHLLASADKKSWVWAEASLEDVQAGFETVPYPAERLHFIKGPIEDTVPAQMPDEIAILRLDTDWYESTAHELEHMYPRLVPGGVLLIDDYGHWQGSRKATDEFLDRTGERLLLLRADSGRVAVKP